ncbi:family 43 glycosylhydrolase [Sanguibacter sp. A247]|uniref:family 43 glycosylhydrolase n=1 Tax=unclassified Sanguibacter TaxID=2645534 RepID=UPI003FD85162
MTVVHNPILPGCFPDPSICRVGEDYYLVTSTFEYLPGLPILRSRDLVTWEHVGDAVTDQLDYSGLPSSSGLYAPTIRHHDGLFYIVCTLVHQDEDARGGNFLMTATDPAGPWSAPVWLEVGGIDPSIFFDDDGRAWLHGTRLVDPDPEWFHQTEVWLREYSLTEQRLVGPEHILWTGALRGAVWAEGPHLYKIDGTYYLLAAEGGTEIHHAVSVARADTVTGPYTGNKGNPVLTHRHLGSHADVVGVGHADLVQAVDGSWWAVCLAMRPYGGYHYNLGRETHLVPVEWEDGWPVFAPRQGRVPAVIDVPFGRDEPLSTMQGAASGIVTPSDPRWTALRALPLDIAEPAGDGWQLPVRADDLTGTGVPAFLGVRQQHIDVDVTIGVRAELAVGEEVGLVVRQSERDHVRLALVRDGNAWAAVVTHRTANVDTTLGSVVLDLADGADVDLRLRARGQDYELSAAVTGSTADVIAVADGRTLDTVATGGFLGLWVGAYATSAGAATTSVATIRHLTYDPA